MAKKIKSDKLEICLPSEVEAMSRRSLLQTGVSLAAYASTAKLAGLTSTEARGQSDLEAYPVQRKLIWINMRGGWDILEVTDPKTGSTSGIDMIYDWGDTHAVGSGGTRIGRWLPGIAGLGNDLLVIRGLAMGTTSHNAGSIYMDTGVLSNAGNVNAASIPAIVASQSAATIPIIQLSGGSDPQIDRGLLNPVSVVRAGNLSLYRSLFPTDQAELDRRTAILDYVKASANSLVSEVGDSDRLQNMLASEDKLRNQFAGNVGEKLALSASELAEFTAGAPAGFNSGIANSFALAEKLVREDIVDVVNLGVGGFDTHSNQSTSLSRTLPAVDFAISTLATRLRDAGKLDSTLIVLYSDFGRTPKINNSNGRDHWPVGGALMIGGGIDGGRAVGGTDDDLRALTIHSTSGEVVSESDSNGIQLNPTHLGGSVLRLALGSDYMQYRNAYLTDLDLLTRLR